MMRIKCVSVDVFLGSKKQKKGNITPDLVADPEKPAAVWGSIPQYIHNHYIMLSSASFSVYARSNVCHMKASCTVMFSHNEKLHT